MVAAPPATGFQPPGSLDFHHTIHVSQLMATVDVHIHYSFEPQDSGTQVNRWLVLDALCLGWAPGVRMLKHEWCAMAQTRVRVGDEHRRWPVS
jgi:hypothetical protein